MSSTLNKTKQAWNNTHQSILHIDNFFFFFFAFVVFLLLLLPSHAIVHVNSIPNKSFYFYYGLSLVTNYYSTLNDVSPLDNKEGHAAFTQ